MKIEIGKIRFDSSTQCRAKISTETVDDYVELWEAVDADQSPFDEEVVLFEESGRYWIGDGWHRCLSGRKAKRQWINADVRKGGRKEAVAYAIGANLRQKGLRRTNADKRRAVEIALKEFPEWSNRRIAEAVGVDHKTVGAVRNPKPKVSQPSSTVGNFPTQPKETTAPSPPPEEKPERQPREVIPVVEPTPKVQREAEYTPSVLQDAAEDSKEEPVVPLKNGDSVVAVAKKVDQLKRNHIGPLTRAIPDISRMLGSEGPFANAAEDALDDLFTALDQLAKGHP